MPFAQNMSILYRKGSVNEADPMSRRPDFFHPDDVQLRMPTKMFALWWYGNVHDLCCKNNDTALLVLSANIVSVDDNFLTKLKLAYSSCPYFCDEIKARLKSHGLVKSSNGL